MIYNITQQNCKRFTLGKQRKGNGTEEQGMGRFEFL